MDAPIISVVIPTFNYGYCVTRAVESVVAQWDDRVEILIIDDGSTDNTQEILDQLVALYPKRVQTIRQSNKGLSATRNVGIDNTTGQYLMFLDADDALCENAFMEIFKIVNHNSFDLIIGGHLSVHNSSDEASKEKYHASPVLAEDLEQRFKDYINKKIAISNGASLIKRDVFKKIRYHEGFRNSEDIPVFGQILVLYPCFSLNKPIAKIYKHDDSLRHNQQYALDIGTKIVDVLFDENILPSNYFKYKNNFYAQRCLSLFRTLYLNKQYKKAQAYYIKAIVAYPFCVTKLSYFRKFIRACLLAR